MRLAPSQESAPASPGGAALFHAPSDARTAYLAQKRDLSRRRGAALVGGVAVPRTTTADVLALATWWSAEVDKLRAGGDLGEADRAAIIAWRGCMDTISRRTESTPLGATYPDNTHVWTCVGRLATHLTRRQVLPSWWHAAGATARTFLDAFDERIDAVGDRMAANAAKVSEAVGAAVGTSAVDSAVKAAAIPIALAASGLVAGVVLLRATSPAARSRRASQRAAAPTKTSTSKKGGRR